MILVYLALGAIIGLLLALCVLVIVFRFRTPLNRNIERLNSVLKTKGAILEPGNEQLESFINSLLKE